MQFPQYTRAEVIADGVIHVLGLSFVLIAGPILIGIAASGGDGLTVAAVSVYIGTMAAMLAMSASYNLVSAPTWKEWLRRLDHGAIYLKIAGTYTPFAAVSIGGGVGRALLIGVWTVAAAGVLMKLAAPRRFEAASVSLYLLLGWAVVWVAGDLVAAVSTATLALLLIGGALYTTGIAFHLWERLAFHNVVWHVFVLAATACFYAAVAVEII